MKSSIARTICFAAVLLGLTAVAAAQGHRACSSASLAGAWGYTETGTVMVPTTTPPTPVLGAAVGRYDFDFAGNFTGTQYSSAGGTVSQDMKVGTYTLNSDCTGTLTLEVYDPSGTVLRRRSVWAVVLVDNATEFRGIMTSMLAFPSGATLSPIMTLTARRLFPRDRGDEQ